MSHSLDFTRGRVALIGIALCIVFTAIMVAIPIAANAAPVNLATAQPFVVLGGAGVTNTGPSVLNGDLGVTPGTSLSGFGAPAVVNGATHANDAVAAQAQADLTTAYNVAAGQAISPGNELTGTDLGGLTLSPGAYGFSTSAQLTGQLTLDAHGDPNAQFVFVIGSTLTTASASSVILTNGASPCNVFWKDRQLGHLRQRHRLRGERHGPGIDLAEQRRHRPRPRPRPQRRSDPDQRRVDPARAARPKRRARRPGRAPGPKP